MASTIRVDALQDTGANDIITSDGSGTFTYAAASGANFTALDADNVSAGTLAIAQGGTGAATFAAAGLANTPNFYAYNPNSQVIATATDTAIIFASEVFDTASAYNVSDGKYTIPSGGDGKWWFNSTIRMAGTGGIPARVYQYIFKNGAVALRKETGGSTTYSSVQISGLVEVAATDYIQVYFYQNGGADMTLSFTASDACWFQGFKLI